MRCDTTGGSVKLVYFTRLGLRAHLYPHKFAILPVCTNIPPPKKRHIYMPYDDSIPPLLFKSRLTANSPLAKYWVPSPIATRYMRVQDQIFKLKAARAGTKTAAAPAPAAAPKKAAKATA